jgi:hypothetical protein
LDTVVNGSGALPGDALVGTPSTPTASSATPATVPTPATTSRWPWLLRHHQPRSGPGSDWLRPRMKISRTHDNL